KAFDTERMYERAIADYTRVLSSPSRQSDNFHASVYFRRGNAQEKLQQLGPALDDYRQAAALNPRCRDAANALKRLVAALPDGCAVRTHLHASETILSSPSNAPRILRALSTLRWNILRSKEARKPKRFVDE